MLRRDCRRPALKSKCIAKVEGKAERRKRAWELRVRGWSMRRIGEEIGVSLKTVWNYVHEALAEVVDETRHLAEVWRGVELERLDGLLEKWFPLALFEGVEEMDKESFDRSLKAVGVVLKVIQERSRLLGLYDAEEMVDGEVLEVPLEELGEKVGVRSPLLLEVLERKEDGDGEVE